MKTGVKLFKIEADYGGEPRSGFIYAANEDDAQGLFVNEWTWGTHDDIPITTKAIFVIETEADVAVEEDAPVARFLTSEEKAAWRMKLEPGTFKPVSEIRADAVTTAAESELAMACAAPEDESR